jgi:hypothetical protein
MRYPCLLFFFCFGGRALAQIPSSSPALDQDFIVLKPTESFIGYYANQTAGYAINMGTMEGPNDEYSDIFIQNVDTSNFHDSHWSQGLFKGGPEFSLFNKALMRLEDFGVSNKVYFRGYDKPPDLIGEIRWFRANDWYSYIFDSIVNFVDSGLKTGLGHTKSLPLTVRGRAYQDIIGVGDQDSCIIAYYKGSEKPWNGERFGTSQNAVLRATKEWRLPFTPFEYLAKVVDVDRDGVEDVIFPRQGDNKLMVCFGKAAADTTWELDTVIEQPILTYHAFLITDFLYEDSIKDLVLYYNDTVFCYNGNRPGFLRTPLDPRKYDLAIPSPAKLDNQNFLGNGKGLFYEWGDNICDAGDINGSAKHSIALFAEYAPDTSASYSIGYCFIYSGGKAADEKADAIFASDVRAPVLYHCDTIRYSYGEPDGIIVTDGAYNLGNVGAAYYFKGTKDIPHKPNPKWGIYTSPIPSNFVKISTSSTDKTTTVFITSPSFGFGTLTLRDILGRSLEKKTIPYFGDTVREVTLDNSHYPNGCYVLQYEEDGKSCSSRIIIIH